MAPSAGKNESSTAAQMKLFIQYVDTRGIHLYTAFTRAFYQPYQNKSCQGQIFIFTHTPAHVVWQQSFSNLKVSMVAL